MKGEEFALDCSAYGMVHMLRHKGLVEVHRREAKKTSFIRHVFAAHEAEVARG